MFVLSLFPGIGLLDAAFEEMGFCVVRGPDLLWGGDIKEFHPPSGRFDGVIGGPPCQAWSRLRHIVAANGYQTAPDLIPEFERCIAEAAPEWFLMENVPEAPEPAVPGYIVRAELIRDVWVGGETSRMRRFSFGTQDGKPLNVETLALHRTDPDHAALATGGRRPVPVAIGGSGKPKRSSRSALCNYGYNSAANFQAMCRAQGLDENFLSKSPLTMEGKSKAVGNGVPLPMGRAVARAVKAALAIPPRAGRMRTAGGCANTQPARTPQADGEPR
jgi:DNA (cytosine-5)-methyltransferase 1